MGVILVEELPALRLQEPQGEGDRLILVYTKLTTRESIKDMEK